MCESKPLHYRPDVDDPLQLPVRLETSVRAGRSRGCSDRSLPSCEDAHLLPNTYVILPGHPRIDNEEVIEHLGTSLVVQKS